MNQSIRTLGPIALALIAAASPQQPADATETLHRIDWAVATGPPAAGRQAPGLETGLDDQGETTLRIRSDAGAASTIPLWSLDEPGITASGYALTGRLRHDGVAGDAYLEMWSHFPDGQSYFSRTLAVTGPLRALRGDSPWRDLVLPFHLGEEPQRPVRLELNLHLPGEGEVEISPLSLVQFGPGEGPLEAAAPPAAQRVPGGAYALLLAGLGAGVGALVILAARRRRMTQQSELRKIEALDAR